MTHTPGHHLFTDDGLAYNDDRLYHYTTASNARQIIKSGMIKPSRNELHDCMYGVGIYFTAVCPCNSKREILHNNYVTETYTNEDKADAVIALRRSELHDVRQVDSRRNIWLYSTSKPLDLVGVHGTVFCLRCERNCKQCDGVGTQQLKCNRCDASGVYTPYRRCNRCDGQGEHLFGGDCDECNGTGNYFWNKQGGQCYKCDGDGYTYEQCHECNGAGQADCGHHHHFCNC